MKDLSALAEQWNVEAILLLGGQRFNPLNAEIFAPLI